MPDLPYPLSSNQVEELKPQIQEMLRDIYENRIGGATLGDVFRVSGDTLQLQIKAGCGLQKTNGELDFDKTVIGTTASDISNTPSGTISSTTVQDAINELDSEKLQTGGIPNISTIALKNGVAEPSAVEGKSIIYIDIADGLLKMKNSSGDVYKFKMI